MSAKRETTTRAIVIGRIGAGEGSVRVLLYAEDLGLVAAIAKSAREERSKLRPHLTVGTFGTFMFVKGERDWRVVGATRTTNSHFVLSSAAASSADATTAKQEASARVIGVVRSLVHGEGVNAELFAALWNFLSGLATVPTDAIAGAEHRAVLGILAALGYVESTDVAARDMIGIINKGLAASGLA